MPQAQAPKYFPALTGVRALLAWNVFLFHYGNAKPIQKYWFAFSDGGGEAGVSLFFLLSGFLIAFQYSSKSFIEKGSLTTYFFRRWARIYPLFFVISLISLLFLFFSKTHPPLTATNIILHFTLLKGLFQEKLFFFIGPAWSLTVEECFYVTAPLIFLLRRRLHLMVQCLCIILVGMLITWIAQQNGSRDFMHEYNFMFYWTFFGRAFQFFCGIWLAIAIQKRGLTFRNLPVCTLIGLVGLIGAQMAFTGLHKIHILGSPDALAIAFNNGIIPIIGVLFFYGLASECSPLRTMLETPLFQLLGKSSFAFYLLHLSPFIRETGRYFELNAVSMFCLVLLLSIVFYYALERPVHNLLNALWARRANAPALPN